MSNGVLRQRSFRTDLQSNALKSVRLMSSSLLISKIGPPLSGLLATADFTIQGVVTPPGKAGPTAHYRMVDAGYFGAMGIPILAGRGIRARDTDRAMSVAVASQSLARRYWPNVALLGSHIVLDDDSTAPPRTVEIVGVAGDVGRSAHGLPVRAPRADP